ncbi:MAG: hypothetical protein PPFGHCPK_01325 [Spiroplasma endosymbiont of Drosophila atripex]|nr:MAG: hypothetical protein PPFGHCPK_00031 [Spiroplasma endosymbiont of Drosophila atripex]WDA53870.1 MAG: hypothetical protein PPFGHCPK_00284 [Spiroplasma endosymbiont of Drosophila atripex]WDA54620.1 MAG: hypothetical protein PPFGHCPK_01076 [Spiroplasma endosymbiont of Drosophila atripex]WDA54844.1 MAG: hypothetical protein PPFGHCPK_01325 [Spiroplasma endosymbiont of Drosophila atripex]
MIWWEILLIIPILITSITLIIFLIFIIKDLKKDYKVLKKLNIIAKDLEKKEKLNNE